MQEDNTIPRPHIALVGCGHMGKAILRGMLAQSAWDVSVIDPSVPDDSVAGDAQVFDSLRSLRETGTFCDIMMFAVKPQQIRDVIEEYRALGLHRNQKGKPATVISIAAGVKCGFFTAHLGSDVPVIRAMPNLPISVGYGMTGYYATRQVTPKDKSIAEQLFSHSGVCCEVKQEDLVDAITAVSGSGPAYFFYLAECMAAAGEALGLPADIAEAAAAMTLTGAGAMMSEGTPTVLRERVTSPGGTTAQALAALSLRGGLPALTEKAVEAAYKRAAELSRITGDMV